MLRTSRLRQASVVTAGAVVASLLAHASPAHAAPGANAAAAHRNAQTCANSDMVYRPRSAFPNTSAGLARYALQANQIRSAVLCLVNAQRTSRNLTALSSNNALYSAARGHVMAAVSLKWWGKVAPGKNCRPLQNDPTTCDPHINPQTGSTIEGRVRASGYLTGCRSYNYAENTYTGWGTARVTPRAAVTWWMGSPGHRAAILNPVFRETGIAVARGSADPAAGSTTPAAAYVQLFGNCVR
ncbi:CAP domain-containing protein [Actinocorallia populi]|uniref:CAP domain-containing protein n=1 Tax=Actinocorallia populi TaxID=2079200 RepID=UPI0013006F64|nr:CAP domain-containing protein [Actinocorallia populi]